MTLQSQLKLFAASLRPAAFVFVGIIAAFSAFAPPAWAAPAATTTTLAVTSGGSVVTTVTSGSVVTLTATVKAGTTPLTMGQVTFCDAAAKYCTDIHIVGTAQLTKAGTATFKFRPGIGSHSYKAVFAGTKKDATSASGPTALTVTGLNPTRTAIAQTGSAGNFVLTVTVSGNGSAAPTGAVSLLDTGNGNAVLGTVPLGLGTTGPNFMNISNLPGNYPASVAVGDFNGDGIPDLAVANGENGYGQGAGSVSIFLGNGDGTFTATAVSPATGQGPGAVVVADFNEDGIPDLAVLNGNDSTVTVLLGNGDGTFTATAASPATGYGPSAMAVGDFNGDGIPDLAVPGRMGDLTVLLGNGDGTFTAAPASTTDFVYPMSIVAGDFNGDGILDLAVTNEGEWSWSPPMGYPNGTVTILLGKGDGTFTAAKASPTTGVGPRSVAVGDFNGDGILDLAVADQYSSTVTVLLGNGDGTFTATKASPETGGDPMSIAAGDFNGDGIVDLAVANTLYGASGLNIDGMVTVLLGKGDGTFTAAAAHPSIGTYPQGIAAGDFNADGIPDLVVANYVSGVPVLLTENQSASATATGIAVPAASGTQQVAASYPGDSDYKPSTSGSISVTPILAVNLTSSVASMAEGSSATFTATFTGTFDGVTPTGKVDFTVGKWQLGTVALNATGVATLTTSAFGLDCHSILANYEGDSNYAPAASNLVFLWVTGNGVPPLTLTSSASTVTYGTPITFTSDLARRCYHPTGLITYSVGAIQWGAEGINSNGITSLSTSMLPGGKDSVTATYSEDVNYPVVTSNAVSVTVNPVAPAVSLTSSADSVAQGSPVTFTATVTRVASGVTPTGTVTFLDGSTKLGPGTLNSGGVATYSTSKLAAGTHSITAA